MWSCMKQREVAWFGKCTFLDLVYFYVIHKICFRIYSTRYSFYSTPFNTPFILLDTIKFRIFRIRRHCWRKSQYSAGLGFRIRLKFQTVRLNIKNYGDHFLCKGCNGCANCATFMRRKICCAVCRKKLQFCIHDTPCSKIYSQQSTEFGL